MSFGPTTGIDAQNPAGSLAIDSSGNLYGTASSGRANGVGAVFEFIPAKHSEVVIHSFSDPPSNDGMGPIGHLIWDSTGNLYGTTLIGGTDGNGAVFKITAAGTESVLDSFGFSQDGTIPYADLVMDSSGSLYGTTTGGGAKRQPSR